MKHKFFKILVSDSIPGETELNAFIAQHRVSHVARHFVAEGVNSFWAICVTWLDNQGTHAEIIAKRKNRIDYKDVLNEEDFKIYARLRDLRKAIAEREAIPVYHIFTNEQLATIVQQRILTKTALLAVEGIGQTRVDKYGKAFLDCIKAGFQPPNSNEANPDNT